MVVVAIIGILAAVGVVAYNGYTKAAKINTTKTNYKNITKYIQSELLKCLLGGELEAHEKYLQGGYNKTVRGVRLTGASCAKDSDSYSSLSFEIFAYLHNYGNELGFSNPWNPDDEYVSSFKIDEKCPTVVGRITCNNIWTRGRGDFMRCCCKWGEGNDDIIQEEFENPF